VAGAYLLALPALVLLFLAGASLGVHLRTTQWLEMAGLLLVGLAPFVVLGFILGYLLRSDAAVPAVGGVVVLFALFGGVFGFQLATSGPLFEVMKAVPSYWLVQAGKTALGGGGWPAQAWIVIAVWTAVLVPIAVLVFRQSARRA
jgi:ABC-2 type transport system permease protein